MPSLALLAPVLLPLITAAVVTAFGLSGLNLGRLAVGAGTWAAVVVLLAIWLPVRSTQELDLVPAALVLALQRRTWQEAAIGALGVAAAMGAIEAGNVVLTALAGGSAATAAVILLDVEDLRAPRPRWSMLLAAWGVTMMTRLIPASIGAEILNVAPVRLDAEVLLFTLAVSVGTGILFGLAPALAATRLNLSEKLKEGSQSTGARDGGLRGALAVAELSLALILLIGAGLLIKSFYRVLSVDPGFTTDHVLTMSLSLTDSRYPRAIQKRAFYMEDRPRSLIPCPSVPIRPNCSCSSGKLPSPARRQTPACCCPA